MYTIVIIGNIYKGVYSAMEKSESSFKYIELLRVCGFV